MNGNAMQLASEYVCYTLLPLIEIPEVWKGRYYPCNPFKLDHVQSFIIPFYQSKGDKCKLTNEFQYELGLF